MAIYEYQCEACGVIEVQHPMDASPLRKCPKCGKTGVTRLISLGAFQLKGSGWYKTDYKNGTRANSSGTEN